MNNINEIFSTTLSDALGWTLLHSLWQAALVVVLLLIIKAIFRNFSAKVHYGFSIGAMCLFFVTIMYTLIYYMNVPIKLNVISEVFTPAPILDSSAGQQQYVGSQAIWSIDAMINQLPSKFPILLLTWLVGMMLTGFKLAGGYLYLNGKIKKASKFSSLELGDLIESISGKLGLKKAITACEVDFVDSPAVFGHLKPIILIPIGLFSHLSPEQVEMVLMHEIAHIKRNDFLVNLLQSALEVVFFFNPGFWWISKTIRQDRENCCDDMIMATNHRPVNYIKTLAALNFFTTANHKLLPALLGDSKHQLLRRMQRLVNKSEQINMISIYKLGAIILMLGLISYVGLTNNRDLSGVSSTHELQSSFSLLPNVKVEDEFSNEPVKFLQSDTTKNDNDKEKEALILEQKLLIQELQARIRQLEGSERNKSEEKVQRQMKELELELSRKMELDKLIREKVKVNLQHLNSVKLDVSRQIEQLLNNPNLVNNDAFKEILREEEIRLDKLMQELDRHKSKIRDLDISEHERLLELAHYNAEILAKVKNEMRVSLELARKNIGETKEKLKLHREKIIRELKVDKLLNKNQKKVRITSKKGNITVNGKKLDNKLTKKYSKLLDEMFGRHGQSGDHDLIITFDND